MPWAGRSANRTEPIGRERELRWIEERLEAGDGAWLVGDAGIGKTTVWAEAVARAGERGLQVLTAAPTEAEQTFSYSVLGDLLGPFLNDVEARLPATQRVALQAMLLLRDGAEAADVRTLSVAVRTALGELGVARPVVVAIDDIQWTDPASVAVLDYALRRSPGVRTLVSSRRGLPAALQIVAPTLEVEALSAASIHRLLRDRLRLDLPRTPLLRLHEISGGNAFYALELGRAYARDGEVALSESLHQLVTARLRGLPAGTRRALAAMAVGADPTGDLQLERALEPAVRAGVVRRTGEVRRFDHPLLAEAAAGLILPGELRRVHREIGHATADPEQRLRHLALAAQGPDAALAASLAEAAEAAERRGTFRAAGQLWELAATVTPPDAQTTIAERRVQAGIDVILSGDPDAGAQMLTRNIDATPPGPVRQRGLVHLALDLARLDERTPIPILEQALAEATDMRLRREVVQLLSAFFDVAGNAEGAAQIVRSYLDEVEALGDDELVADALVMLASRETRRDRPAWHLIDRADALRARHGQEPSRHAWGPVHHRFFALIRDGRFDEARALLDTLGSAGGTAFAEGGRYTLRAIVHLASGQFEGAEDDADELLAIGEQMRTPFLICDGLVLEGTAASLRGATERARAKASRAIEFATQVHALPTIDEARFALGLDALSRGDAAEAADHFRQVMPAGWHRQHDLAGGRPHIDAVEAFVRVGDLARAREIAAAMPEDAHDRPIAAAIVAAADGDLSTAIDILQSGQRPQSPFRRARQRLLLGRFLRQARRRNDAREALEAARSAFEEMKAPFWAERAQEELARLGGRRPIGATLTESERRVAELVAAGLSNKEIAAALVVTVRTVEAHLSKAFAKLGLVSRAALASRWPALEIERREVVSASVDDRDASPDAAKIVVLRNRRAAVGLIPSESNPNVRSGGLG